MWKRLIYIILPAMMLIAACKRIKDLADISVTVPYTGETELPALGGGGTPIPGGVNLSLPVIGVETQSAKYIEEYNTSPDNVKHAILRELSMQLLTPPNGTFDFVDSIEVYISARGLPEIMSAYRYGIPPGTDSVAMQCIDDNLKAYFLKDSIFIRLQAHFISVPDSALKLRMNTKFNVVANPLY